MKLCGTVLLLLDLASSCSDWIMDDAFGLSVRTMDLGPGPTFSLKTQPKGYKPAGMAVPAAKYGHIISIGANLAQPSKGSQHHLELDGIISGDAAFAGLNEAGLSCDLHALVNSSYPPRSSNASANNLMLFHFCNWALGSYATAADVRRALEAGVVHLWGPSAAERDGDPSAGDRNLCPPAPCLACPC
jgi:penicillin V acylase-like amidase (Ntn superfamily)